MSSQESDQDWQASDISSERNSEDEADNTDEADNGIGRTAESSQTGRCESHEPHIRTLLRRNALGPDLSETELRSRSGWIRLAGWHRPRYLEFLEKYMDHVERGEFDVEFLRRSQIGMVDWSVEEKARLFSDLALYGKHDIKTIAEDIATKSEAEVLAFLQLLHHGTIESHLRSTETTCIGMDEIPAAIEVTAERERELELAAQRVEWHGFNLDQADEEAKYDDDEPDYDDPDLDCETAGKDVPPVDDLMEQDTSTPTGNFLDKAAWVQLAELFMTRDACGQGSWVDYILSNDERPSIFRSAYEDFTFTAKSLTRRIAEAALLQAESRIQSSTRFDGGIKVITVEDVRSACRIMGMTNHWNEYWTTMPRRCGLTIFTRTSADADETTKLSHARTMTYEEVEHTLRSAGGLDGLVEQDIPQDSTEGPTEAEGDQAEVLDDSTDYDSDLWTDQQSDAVSTDVPTSTAQTVASGDSVDPLAPEMSKSDIHDEDSDSSSHEHSTKLPYMSAKYIAAETAYLEALDQRASRNHDLELQRVLARPRELVQLNASVMTSGAEPGSLPNYLPTSRGGPKGEEDDDLPPLPPKRRRKTMAELREWRDAVEWVPEWVGVEDGPVPKEAFAAMGRRGAANKRRRLERYKDRMQRKS